MRPNSQPNEKLQFAFLYLFLLTLFLVFFINPSLRSASLLTVLNVLLLSPAIRFLGRHRVPKFVSILCIYAFIGLLFVFSFSRILRGFSEQWSSLVETLPVFGEAAIQKIGQWITEVEGIFNLDINLGIKDWLSQLGGSTQSWALNHIPSMLGDFASALLLAPIFSFFLLKDGEQFREQFKRLIPRSRADATILVLDKIFLSLGQFIRAKVIEGLLMAVLCYIGLKIIGAPYAGAFAVIAGVTNIIPYLGPILGVIPPALVSAFSDSGSLFWPIILVFAIANAVDMILIFPVFVAKLVNLSPMTLLAAVAVGQELNGVLGMLLAVPSASILKIIFQEMVSIIYE